ncbi:MAG TPA: class I SAM-dependent methyltransferase, partial [Candidatus Absconditabacterales bacterium]|nr:class I SAM-dependent methyltransferase [Candidatus Absconditabacterales bacterium]
MNIIRKAFAGAKVFKQDISRLFFGKRIAELFSGDPSGYFDNVYRICPDIYGDKHHSILDNVIPSLSLQSKILDVGCGKGKDSIRLAEQGFTAITAIDPSYVGLELFRDKVLDSIKDNITIHNISISDYISENKKEKFDLISCANSLQYELQRDQCIKDLQDMTNPGGYHMIMGPVIDDKSRKKLNQEIINNLYSHRTIIQSEIFNKKRKDHDRPRLHFIAQKK